MNAQYIKRAQYITIQCYNISIHYDTVLDDVIFDDFITLVKVRVTLPVTTSVSDALSDDKVKELVVLWVVVVVVPTRVLFRVFLSSSMVRDMSQCLRLRPTEGGLA